MNVSEALQTRQSTRAFLSKRLSDADLLDVFKDVARSPSNCNVQPWQLFVLSGEIKQRLSDQLVEAVTSGAPPNPEIEWCLQFNGQHKDRQHEAARVLYDAMGIKREDRASRHQALLRNWQFFDAPHVAIFTMDRYLGSAGCVDLGICAQSLALRLRDLGANSCFQAALNQYPNPIRQCLNLDNKKIVVFGMSFGYPDLNAPVNTATTPRAELSQSVTFMD